MSEWQPIETAPLWELVNVYDPAAFPYRSSNTVYSAVQTKVGEWPKELATKPPKSPTHWMPLPNPPRS